MPVPLPEGHYIDLLSERGVDVRDGEMVVPETAVILRYSGQLSLDACRQPSLLL